MITDVSEAARCVSAAGSCSVNVDGLISIPATASVMDFFTLYFSFLFFIYIAFRGLPFP